MIENSWFYYFSSLAQTVAAGSALLVALAIIRLQNLENSLISIERSISEAFYNIAEFDNYRKQASIYFLNEEWSTYFNNIKQLAESSIHKFSMSEEYTQSKEFLDFLIAQGIKFETRHCQLHRALVYGFTGTIIFAGVSILAIPIAQWISPWLLWFSWAVTGIFLIVLFIIYYRLIIGSLKWKKNEW